MVLAGGEHLAEHPMNGGRTLARLRFFVATDDAGDLAGHVRAVSADWPRIGSETYASPNASDANVAAGLAIRLLKMSGTLDAVIFRTAL
jgi:hypothetical protein